MKTLCGKGGKILQQFSPVEKPDFIHNGLWKQTPVPARL
jgi:hypothetical protein